VFSKAGKVVWCAESDSFRHRIAKGRRVRPESVAHRFFAERKLDEEPRMIPARTWINADDGVELVEHAIASDEHGTVLSMLWLPP
jgi:hypothetical protein